MQEKVCAVNKQRFPAIVAVVEFISLDAMCRLVRSAGWGRADVLRAIEQGQLVAIQVEQPRTRNKKWAIVHPGVQFLDYVRNPETRMRYISILSERDVAAILGRDRNYVRWLIRTNKIKSHLVKYDTGRKQRRYFTIENVRQYLIESTGRDPKKRYEPTADVMVRWFLDMMEAPPKVTGPAAVDEELRWIDELPEPERSQKIDAMLRLAEEAREQLRIASGK